MTNKYDILVAFDRPTLRDQEMTFEELLTLKNKANAFQIWINSNYKGQLDLTEFINLKELYCRKMSIESIDVSGLNKLKYIYNSKNVKRLTHPKNTKIVY